MQWDTRPNFLVRSSRVKVDLLSYESKTTNKRQQNDWRAKKNLDEPVQIFLSPPVVLLSFISQLAVVQELIDLNTTGLQEKIWTGCINNKCKALIPVQNLFCNPEARFLNKSKFVLSSCLARDPRVHAQLENKAGFQKKFKVGDPRILSFCYSWAKYELM